MLRYKIEMELALILLIVFGARPLVEKLDVRLRAALALLLVVLAAQQVISHRRFARNILRSVRIEETVEYQVARWLDTHVAGQRVMMPGSIGQWLERLR